MSEKITVGLGERSYDILVGDGLIADVGTHLKPLARGPVPVVTDTIVEGLHLNATMDALRARGIDARPVVLEAGEATKAFAALERLTSVFLRAGVERGGLIVALGGGVVGDLVGFASAITKRGIPFAQIPTTLLAQVDSSVGGKTAINTAEGKNLVGVFHQPRIVIADTDLLTTLPKRELLAGYAEVVKYAALGDRTFFEWLEVNGPKALKGDGGAMTRVVAHCCRLKAGIVERDERETGERALLNLGHTFGHALEAETGCSNRLLHGESVAIGTALAFRLSVALGLCPGQDAERFIAHLKAVGMPSSIDDIPGPRPAVDDLIVQMQRDKKARDGKINFILLHGIGDAFMTNDVPMNALKKVLA
ncbi:MAG TPA: 3-dehydroquinate synthase [Rhizomicrobium sp.]|nr:3-dehydroquinate synthase [Rhizomicrobium sp.]